MAISIQKYVDIVSGVGGASAFAARELIGRLFSSNVLIPTDALIDFDTLEEVGSYFGTSSEEYDRAQLYFGFISKLTVTPNKITFARWTDVDVAARIFGSEQELSLTEWQAITDGSFTLNLAGVTVVISALNFSTDVSFAEVATRIEAAIQAASVDPSWATATVTFNAITQAYDFIGGATVVADISVEAGGVGTEIYINMGWATNAIFSDGKLAESPLDAITASSQASNNFGSFLFQDVLTIDQITELAEFTNAQNVVYQYCVPVLDVDVVAYNAALIDFSGVGLTLVDAALPDEFDEMTHMIVLAATNYTKRNSTQNYMFQQFAGLSAKVSDDTTSNTMDALRVNYIGETQQAGRNVRFYQRGFLMGGNTAPVNMNTFANEQWLKDAAIVALLNLELALAKISANDRGRNQIAASVQGVIDDAVDNGTISIGRNLDDVQKAFITDQTGDDLAYHQVESLGYWLNVQIEDIPSTNPVEQRGVYQLIYAKDNVVRSIDGTHTLI